MALYGIDPAGTRPNRTRPHWPFAVNTASPQARDLAAWYPMGLAGSTLVNLVGTTVDGTNQSTPGVRAVVNHGLTQQFEDATWFVTSSAPYSVSGATAFSMSCWIRTDVIGGVYPVNEAGIVGTNETGTRTDTTTDKCFGLTPGGTGITRARFYVYDGSPKFATGTSEILDIGPALLVGTFDGSNIRYYANGVLEATTAASGTYAFTTPQMIWSQKDGTIGIQGFRGDMWDCRYYHRCLSAADVAQMYDLRTRWDLYRVPERRVWVPIPTPQTGLPWWIQDVDWDRSSRPVSYQ